MNSKIEKSFQNSQFYRNYNNIDTIILKFKKIKNEYTESKNKYKNNLISIVNTLNKNQIQSNFYDKFNKKINIEEHILNSYRNILNKKLNFLIQFLQN